MYRVLSKTKHLSPEIPEGLVDMSVIHIIDDEPDIGGLIREVVEGIGLKCQTYSSAADFLDAWGRVAEHDLIILDLMMPKMDGIELMRKLVERGCPQGIILISGSDQSILHSAEVLALAQGLRILKAVAKPIHLSEFSSLILRHAEHMGEHAAKRRSATDIPAEFDAEELEQGVSMGQMVLHYQPQVQISTGRLVGVEALVRWQHPRFGLIFPDRFIPQMEQLGIIENLTREIISTAVERQRVWAREFFPFGMSVNISARDTSSLGLPDQLAVLLTTHQLDPEQLTLEITETALIREQVRSLDMLTRLRLKGVKLSIDDFGTGFSSFLQIYRAPFSELKVDRAFVSRMQNDTEAMTIVEICIQLARKLKMRTVAEGVEDEVALQVLAELGCDMAQGYHIGRPMPEQGLREWIRAQMLSTG